MRCDNEICSFANNPKGHADFYRSLRYSSTAYSRYALALAPRAREKISSVAAEIRVTAGVLLQQCAPVLKNFRCSFFVDLGRIELPSPQCECDVLPLNHRPFFPFGVGVKMPCNTTLLRALYLSTVIFNSGSTGLRARFSKTSLQRLLCIFNRHKLLCFFGSV